MKRTIVILLAFTLYCEQSFAKPGTSELKFATGLTILFGASLFGLYEGIVGLGDVIESCGNNPYRNQRNQYMACCTSDKKHCYHDGDDLIRACPESLRSCVRPYSVYGEFSTPGGWQHPYKASWSVPVTALFAITTSITYFSAIVCWAKFYQKVNQVFGQA